MPPLVIDLMQGWRADLLRGDEAMQREMAQRWLGVERALSTQLDALTLELQRDGGRVTMGKLQRNRRYRELMGQVDDELRKYSRFAERRIVDRQQALLNAAISHSQAAVSAVATEAEMLVQFNRLPVSAVENMVGLTGAGTPVRDILADASRDGPEGLTQELVDGIALGRNPVETARRALRLGLATSFTRMATIARTETLRVYRQTTLESYQRSNVVVAYRRLSARDRRTCIGCLFADGRIYRLDQPFDEHPAGRCAMVPVLRSVPPVQFETGQQWFTRQPESTQRAMLGPSRMDLWQRGEVSLDDLVTRRWDDTWGGALVPAPVRSLRGGPAALQRTQVQRTQMRTQAAANRATINQAAPIPQLPAVREAEMRIYQLRTHEEAYLFDSSGNQLLHKRGGATSVNFNADQVQRFDGNILTHNHPRLPEGSSFSDDDVRVAATFKLAEVRAVGGRYVYSLRMDRALEWADIEPLYRQASIDVRNAFNREIALGNMTYEEANLTHNHEVWTRVGRQLQPGQWQYERRQHNY